MRRSKLESYEAILGALLEKPLNIDNLAYETKMHCEVLSRRIRSLIIYGLVEEKVDNGIKTYVITERGLSVYRTLNFQKCIQKIAKTIKAKV
jgi:predicted transcriptional regulator